MEIILLSLLCFGASAIGTVTGFGTATIMMPLLIIYCPVQEVLFFVSILHWINGFTRVILFRDGFDSRLILSFGLAGVVASYYAATLAFQIDEKILVHCIAYFLIVYSLFLVISPQFKLKFNLALGLSSGLISGFLAGLSGMGGAIRAAFLSAFDFPKAVYLANSALILVLIDSARVVTYMQQGASFSSIATLPLLGFYTVVSILGVKLGEKLVRGIPQKLFRYVVAIMLCLLGLRLLM